MLARVDDQGRLSSDDRFLVGTAGPTPAGPCCGQPNNKCAITAGVWTAAGTISEGNPAATVTRPPNGTY